MQQSRYSNKNPKKQTGGFGASPSKKLLYDARGVRVRKKRFSGGFYNTLLYWVLPFIVINLLIFAFVTATPRIDVQVADTNDYRTTTVTFTVKSLLPVKEAEALWEAAEPIELTKDGKTYTGTISQNGNLSIKATSLNGMTTSEHVNIDILDNTPPQINSDDCEIGDDKVIIKITDSQSGVNFDSIYATDPRGRQLSPSSIDAGNGIVEFPMYLEELHVYAEDMVGNQVQANFSTTNAYKLQQEQEAQADGGSEVSVEGSEDESSESGD